MCSTDRLYNMAYLMRNVFHVISYIGHSCIGEADAVDVPLLVLLVKILDLLQSGLETIVFFVGKGSDHQGQC